MNTNEIKKQVYEKLYMYVQALKDNILEDDWFSDMTTANTAERSLLLAIEIAVIHHKKEKTLSTDNTIDTVEELLNHHSYKNLWEQYTTLMEVPY